MMERAVHSGERVLVVATHGPTVENTHALLRETAAEIKKPVIYSGLTIETAWQKLAVGDVEGHNQSLAEGIRQHLKREPVGCVVLAQLSMTIFLLSFPDPGIEFGVPILTSGQCGFEYVREHLLNAPGIHG
jgi:hypothetical protein